MKKIILLLVLVILISGCAQKTVEEKTGEKTQMANPASVYCEEQGNKLEIRTGEDGSQTGYCIFKEGTECEEWAYFRGECPEKEGTQPRACRNEGEFCGGIAGIMCCEGLTCQLEGTYPDAGGKCVKGQEK